jgi:hypothetical protein
MEMEWHLAANEFLPWTCGNENCQNSVVDVFALIPGLQARKPTLVVTLV